MEADVVGDLAGVEATWKVIYLISELVPCAIVFFGGGVGGTFDWVALFD